MRIVRVPVFTKMIDDSTTDDIEVMRDSAKPEGRSVRDQAETLINSENLLQGRMCVRIRHGDVTYVLRATRAGKLILTK